MIKSRLFCLVVLFLGLVSHPTLAQTKPRLYHKNNYWLGLGLGATHLPSAMGALGYEFTDRPTLIIARYVNNQQVFSDNVPGVKIKEAALLYGVRTGKFRFSTGLSGVWGVKRGKYLSSDPDPLIYGSNYYESIRYTTVGIPGEIRFITSNQDVGLGVTAFGNLNGRQSFAGLNVCLYIGQMKQ